MKLITADGKKILKMTRAEWKKLGADNGWLQTEAKKEEKKDVDVEAGKKGKKVNPWAVCNSKIDRSKNPEKFERCVQDIKKEHPIKD